MPISINEIKTRANAFSKEWQDESREDAEAKSFWDAFFHVFGVERRKLASLEEPVKKSDCKVDLIDMLRNCRIFNQFFRVNSYLNRLQMLLLNPIY